MASIVKFLNHAVLTNDERQYVCTLCHVDKIGYKVDQLFYNNYHNDNIYCYVTIVSNLSILKFNV